MSETGDPEVLSAVHVMEYPYRRSLGPVLGRFFTALQERRIEGSRTRSGRVIVPPTEHDPDTGEAIEGMVEVGPGGAVVSWSWVAEPRKQQPFAHPFAYALIKLDGADVPMLHVVDAGSAERMSTGMRVKPRWSDDPQGGILDLACFEPEA